MLAQNFTPPPYLTSVEFGALVRVLGMLERGEIAHYPSFRIFKDISRALNPVGFNMVAFYGEADCGTIHCIAGWAEIVGGLPQYSLALKRMDHWPLYELFEARDSVCRFDTEKITVEQAAAALRNYLTTGEARWTEVMRA